MDNIFEKIPRQRKIMACVVAVLAIAALVSYMSIPSGTQETLLRMQDSIHLDATYHGLQNKVVITYVDITGAPTPVNLEVLGLADSYRRTFAGPQFETSVEFLSVPKYGWSIHPIVVDVSDHPEFGNIQLKTEVREPGAPAPRVIYAAVPAG